MFFFWQGFCVSGSCLMNKNTTCTTAGDCHGNKDLDKLVSWSLKAWRHNRVAGKPVTFMAPSKPNPVKRELVLMSLGLQNFDPGCLG